MTFTGTALDLDRLPAASSASPPATTSGPFAEGLVADLGGRAMWVPEELRTLYHAGLAHGANHLVTLVSEAMEMLAAAGADDPAGTLRPLLTARARQRARARRRRADRPDRARRRRTPSAPTSPTSPPTRPQTLPSYVALARATARPRRHRRPAAADPRRRDPPACSTPPSAPAPPAGQRRRPIEPSTPCPARTRARSSPRSLRRPAGRRARSAWCRPWARCTRATPA